MSGSYLVRLSIDSTAIEHAIERLSRIGDLFPEATERFLDGSLDLAKVVQVYGCDRPTTLAIELRVCLEPSDRFLEFLAAFPTGNLDGLGVQAEGHEHS